MNRNYIKILISCLIMCSISYGQMDTTLDSAGSSPAQELAYNKESLTDINRLREDAEILREQAEKLYEKAKDIRSESDDMDDAIEDLEDEVDDLEDEAEKLIKQAGNLQTCIKISEDAGAILQADSLRLGDSGDTAFTDDNLHDQKMLMLKMRNSADELLIKAKKISVSVREMNESSYEREDLSDKLEDKAEALEEKAEELEETADRVKEERDLLPLSARFPFRIGHQIRFTSIPPYDDEDAHLLLLSGFNISFYIKEFLNIGAEDITLRFGLYGKRTAISASPIVSFSYFASRRFEFGAGIGTTIQGQMGGDKSNDIALAPFIKLFNENWVTKRFSVGPVIKINFLAKGDLFTRSIPFDNAKALPEKAWWLDFGVTYTLHI